MAKEVSSDLDFLEVSRGVNVPDPVAPLDMANKRYVDLRGSYQKYSVGISETYTIPDGISSVVSGPFELEGILNIEGRLEIL